MGGLVSAPPRTKDSADIVGARAGTWEAFLFVFRPLPIHTPFRLQPGGGSPLNTVEFVTDDVGWGRRWILMYCANGEPSNEFQGYFFNILL